MKSLDEHNAERARVGPVRQESDCGPAGVLCRCGKEMVYTGGGMVLMTDPPQIRVRCPSCGYNGLKTL